MGRGSYADASFRAKQSIVVGGNKGSIDGTYASATDWVRYTFMQPVVVTDWNIGWLVGGTNFPADAAIYLGSSLAGTGAVSVIGTCATVDGVISTDGTQADGSVSDESLTAATTFSTGDDIVVQLSGTFGGQPSQIVANLQYTENFVNTDN